MLIITPSHTLATHYTHNANKCKQVQMTFTDAKDQAAYGGKTTQGVPVPPAGAYPDPNPAENPTYSIPNNMGGLPNNMGGSPMMFATYTDAVRYQRRMARRYGVLPTVTPVYTNGAPMYMTGGVYPAAAAAGPVAVVVERRRRGLIGKAFCLVGLAFAVTGLV